MDAFQIVSGVATVMLNPDMLVDADGRMVDHLAATPAGNKTKVLMVPLSGYFTGGVMDYTYKLASDDEFAGGVVTDAKVKDDMLEYTITVPDAGFAANNGDGTYTADAAYTSPYTGMVTATDANGVSATATVSIMLNRAPTTPGDTDDSGVVNGDALVLGTQAKDRGTELAAVANFHKACAKINECELDAFTDDNGEKLMVSVTGTTRLDKDAGMTYVSSMPTDGSVKLMGEMSTWNADSTPPAHESVTVKLKAMDMHGLMKEVSVLVNVDGAPMVTASGQFYAGKSYEVNYTRTIVDATGDSDGLVGWFEDPEGADLTISATSADDDIATVSVANDALVITGHALDRTTKITVTATEAAGLGQTTMVELMVTITRVGGT